MQTGNARPLGQTAGTNIESFFPSLAGSLGNSTFWLVINPVGMGRVNTVTGPQKTALQPGMCVHCPLAAKGLEKPGREPGTLLSLRPSQGWTGDTRVHKAPELGSAATHSHWVSR